MRFSLDENEPKSTERERRGRREEGRDEANSSRAGVENWRTSGWGSRTGVDGSGGAGTRGFEASHLCGIDKASRARSGFWGVVRRGRRRNCFARKDDFEKFRAEGGVCEGG